MRNSLHLFMRNRLITFLLMCFVSFSLFAQNYEKMSAGTQMLLSERDGETMLPRRNIGRTVIPDNDTLVKFVDPSLKNRVMKRPIAEIETYNGQEMISAFISVNDGNFGAVEALGAVMQTQFNDQLAAMLLPVNKIEAISELSNVIYIEVAEVLEPETDYGRVFTQAVDALTNSETAQALGLTSAYTGKGVILGMIDSGIDFQHLAFKDKDGNSRIVRAYTLEGANSTNLTTYSTASQIASLTCDADDGDHGIHTSTIAGGSSVIVTGDNVTVTDDHANATYGGMAPEVDLVIAGLSSLYTTSITTAIQNICNYADQVGKPCVISMSFGSLAGPHDGTGALATVVNQCAGDNHILVFSGGNNAMRSLAFEQAGTSNGGGCYASGTSTHNKPMMANVQRSFSDADGNVEMLYPTITAYARTANVPTALRFHVVNVNTGEVLYSSNAYTESTTITVTGSSGLAKYFYCPTGYSNLYGDSGKIRITRTQDAYNGKYYWQVYAPIMISRSYSGSSVEKSEYAFCVSVYPTNDNASTIIDMWENKYCWFGRDLTLSATASNNYNLVQGSDDCSSGNYPCIAQAISVGAYVSKNTITNYAGTTTDYSSKYPNIGDHAYFSSFEVEGSGPTGVALPTVNAPGARIVAGINHYHTASVDDDSYWDSDNIKDLVVNSTSAYGAMQGTSMAAPCASGIIALWLQACVEAGKTPTPDYIKEVMAATWDTDQWTEGAGHGAETFGTHGKINAIKGIQYILDATGTPIPMLTVSPESIDFIAEPGETITKTITLTGTNLVEDVSVTLTDANGVYSVDKSSISIDEAAVGTTVTVTFVAPQAMGSYRGQVSFTSGDKQATTVFYGSVGEKGSAYSRYLDIAQYKTIGTGNWYAGYIDNPYKFTEYEDEECAWLTVPSYVTYRAYVSNDQAWTASVNNKVYSLGSSMWSETDVFPGKSYYYTSEDFTVRAIGIYNNTSTNLAYSYYNVKNCTQVKAYCYSYGVNSEYYPFIKIVEVRENPDGTLVQESSTTDFQYDTTASGEVTITSIELDANRIYRVYVASERSVFYEVAFRTPIMPELVDLATLVSEGKTGKDYQIVDGDLTAVHLSGDGKRLYCKDNNKYATPSVIGPDQVDYIFDRTSLMYESGRTYYDQSNWVVLQLPENSDDEFSLYLLDYPLNNVIGKLTDKANPVIELDGTKMPSAGAPKSDYSEKLNTFIVPSFLGNTQTSAVTGTIYFFVTPKPMEFANVEWAMWDGEKFVVPTSIGSVNQANLQGSFYANFSLYDKYATGQTISSDDLIEGYVYSFRGFVKVVNADGTVINGSEPTRADAISGLMAYPLDSFHATGAIIDGVVTGVNDLIQGKTIKVMRYFDTLGHISTEPFSGINIIEVEYTDGTRQIMKKLLK